MRKEVYEKKIAWLEEQLETERRRTEEMRNSTEAKILQALGSRERLYKDLMKFMNGLYTELGKIQSQLLTHMGTVGDQLTLTNKAKVGITVKEFQKLIGIEVEPVLFEEESDVPTGRSTLL